MSDAPVPPNGQLNLPAVRRVTFGRPLAWLYAGWQDMRANPIASIAYGLLFAIAGDLILLFSWRNPHLFSAAVSGFFLIAPLLAAGLYEISRRQALGEHSTFIDSLAGWRRNWQSMAMLGLFLALIAIVWERTSAIMFAFYVPGKLPDLWVFVSEIVFNAEYRGVTFSWFFVGGSVAMLVFAISAVSAPMLINRDVYFISAILTSLRAVARNFDVMMLWAALVVTLTLTGFATLLFGLVILMPLIGHASWHACRELVEA
jgi:uncharacterized membrane protein